MSASVKSPFLSEWVRHHAARTPEAPAVATPQHRLSYGELAARVADLAGHLADRGVGPQDRVVVAVPTSTASVVAILAVHSLGACAVEIDRAMGRRGFATVLEQARPRYAIIAAQDAPEWREAQGSEAFAWAWVLRGGDGAAPNALGTTRLSTDGALPGDARGLSVPSLDGVSEGAHAVVLYTSGSTGTPRGVVQTYRNIAANSRSIVEYLGLGPADRVMAILPFYYCYGRSLLQTHLLAGGSVFYDPRFMYPRVVMEAIGSEGCTGFAGVPMTFEIIRREVDLSTVPMPRLRYLTQAGGPMRPDTIAWVRKAFAPAKLFVMYGQTEATARLAYLPPERAEEKHGSIGVAIPHVVLSVVDEAGTELPAGEVGHLVARGENVTPGYLGAPEDTAAILHDGWLWTGDLARKDEDGFLFIAGRAKEMLKVGGFRVSPLEIENLVLEHPDVKEAVVVGIPDELQGEVIVAFVVQRPGVELDEQAVRRFCREQLPAYKVPARVEVVEAIPRNPSGKPLKAELAARARSSAAARTGSAE
jgi:acyl-CoA synthetase (AMP-forming)/AMP-acid ligase II